MLRPQTARTLLHLILTLSLLITVLFVVADVGLSVQAMQAGGSAGLRLRVPVSVLLELNHRAFHVTEMMTPSRLAAWSRPMWLALTVAGASLWFLAARRVRALVDRLLDDPFDPANLRDLRLAVWVALVWQGLMLVSSLVGWLQNRDAQAQALSTLGQSLSRVPASSVSPHSTFNVLTLNPLGGLGLNLTPLVIAAALTILATVLRQAAALREEERRLRHEQALTI
ncbi:hypothetical protein [Deinococcus sonorensis]|uniref:DUF2975 domain-containing protein n=2 Tax=Deinococcus sonorensis TaxID=309891 RepID=A0AAU7UE25_9DEIO